MVEAAPTSLVIADDDASMRAALVELIESEPRLALVGIASDAGEAAALVEAHSPNVLLLDLRMPGGGKQVVREVSRLDRPPRVVVLTAQDDDLARRVMTAAGVSRFLVKGVAGEEILAALLEG